MEKIKPTEEQGSFLDGKRQGFLAGLDIAAQSLDEFRTEMGKQEIFDPNDVRDAEFGLKVAGKVITGLRDAIRARIEEATAEPTEEQP